MSVIRHLGYSVEPVYQALTKDVRNEILVFWLESGALSDIHQAKQRVEQVAFVVRDPELNVVGVSTVYPASFEPDGLPYFYMRMFIHPGHRVTNLMRVVTRATRDYFNDHQALRSNTKGVLIVTENQKLMRPGARKQFVRDGWTHAGTDPRGLDVWRFSYVL